MHSSRTRKAAAVSASALTIILMASCATTKSTSSHDEGRILQSREFPYTQETCSENSEFLDMKLSYPVFSSERLAELNTRVRNSIKSYSGSFKKAAESDWYILRDARKDDYPDGKIPPFIYSAKGTAETSDDTASVLVTTYIYSGGAHGATQLSSWTYSEKEQKFLDITEASGMDLNVIAMECRDSLIAGLKYGDGSPSSEAERKQWIRDGTAPEHGNYEIFTVDGRNLTVWFEEYKVAPYSCGIQKVRIKLRRGGN